MTQPQERIDPASGEITEVPAQDFSHFIRQLNYGEVNTKLSEALRAAVEATDGTGKRTRVSLTVTVMKGKGGAMELYPVVAVDLPKKELGADIMYRDDSGGLTHSNPRQRELTGLRAVGEDKRDARTVDGEPARAARL